MLWVTPALTSCVSTHKGAEDAEWVTVCQVYAEPKRYDHKLLRISGTMSHGFEGFVLADDRCETGAIWLEYGGSLGSGTVFAGEPSSERARGESLVIEGVPTSMVYDHEFRKFDGLIRRKRVVQARVSIEGRFFSGELLQLNAPFYGGYGHLDMFSLLVIQKVVSSGSELKR
jgi:hypothetical protein